MKKNLLFVSPRFLFPADSGGKIRTSQILRGMKGGQFNITLASPAPADISSFKNDLNSICDRFVSWPELQVSPFNSITRMRHIFSKLPIPVLTDRSKEGSSTVQREIQNEMDIIVFDFPHSAIFAPDNIEIPSVMFTHNVEAEIFHRHVDVAQNPLIKAIWNNQYKKMVHFENEVLSRFDTIIAVSEKDADHFKNLDFLNIETIPTGTDIHFYSYEKPKENKTIVFTGSMDWNANIDGINYMIDKIWPIIVREEPEAKLLVVGRNPPNQLINKCNNYGYNVEFTGFVDDVRTYAWDSCVYIIPLRVGSGTRIKAFEAMAMGSPVVSTTLGVEGLEIEPGRHYLNADTETSFADSVLTLMRDKTTRENISKNARNHVVNNFSSDVVAKRFEDICVDTYNKYKSKIN
ncbi:MAG: glycosyltransferase family 4 protein [Gammaproteobacteria bacterium]|nr:glycosyltransferase family 4 protein [Gammaproteobacteria bacterium]